MSSLRTLLALSALLAAVAAWPVTAAPSLRPVAPATETAPATATGGPAVWRIELREQAQARGAWVTLDDVAVIRTPEPAAVTRLMAVSLAPSPRLSSGLLIVSRQDVQRAVAPIAAEAGVSLQLSGASRAVVERGWQSVPGASLADVARRAVADAMGGVVSAQAAWPTRMPRDLALPGGVVALSARTTLLPRDDRARATVWIDVLVDGRPHTSVPVDLAILGAMGTEMPIEAKPGVAPSAPPRSPAPVVQAAAVALPAAPAAAASAPMVTRGMQVTLRGGNGPLRIEQAVQVLENGGEGQVIRVRAAGATEPVLARVVSPVLVESTE